MNKYLSLGLVLLLILFVLSSCSEHRPAPVRDIGTQSKYKSSQPLSKQNKYRPKSVVVNKGDTLYSIGFKHQLDYKTLAAINGIAPPYRIYPGQRLKLKGKIKTSQSGSNQQVKTQAVKPTFKPVVQSQKPNSTPIKKPSSATEQKPSSNTNTNTQKVSKPPKVTYQAPSSNQKWIWPVKGRLLRTFSSKDVSRKGINISSNLNSPVSATNNGVVVYSGNGLLGYGELIIIKHSDTLLSAYAHNSKRLVNEGDTVKQGDTIAHSGKDSEGTPLLHFEIRKNGQPVNPLNYLPKL